MTNSNLSVNNCYYLTVASRLCAGSYLKQNYEMLAERARGLLSGELSRPDEHETRRPAPRFPQPRIDDFTLKRRRGAVCRLYYPRRLFGAGVADRRARLDRAAVLFAGNAHCAAGSLRDRVERQPLLVWAAVAEPLHLSIDDARIVRRQRGY